MRRRARLLRTEDVHPYLNMALDQVVAAEPPTFRFYSFAPPGLSLGYFQRHDSIDSKRVESLGLIPVRRVTGGGAIAHHSDLTFSIVATARDPVFAGTVEESYDRIHGAIAAAIGTLGALASPRGATQARSDSAAPNEPICFHKATRFDLVSAGHKLVGSAQRRTRDRILHHGSIPLQRNPLATAAADLASVCGRKVEFGELAAALAIAFASTFELEWECGDVTADEASAAKRLVDERFATREWNAMR